MDELNDRFLHRILQLCKNIPGHKVFEAFDKNGVIQLLQDTRNQFPEMDTSFTSA